MKKVMINTIQSSGILIVIINYNTGIMYIEASNDMITESFSHVKHWLEEEEEDEIYPQEDVEQSQPNEVDDDEGCFEIDKNYA